MSDLMSKKNLGRTSEALSTTTREEDVKSDRACDDQKKVETQVSCQVQVGEKPDLGKDEELPRCENTRQTQKREFLKKREELAKERQKREKEAKNNKIKQGTRAMKKGPSLDRISFLDQKFNQPKQAILRYGCKQIMRMIDEAKKPHIRQYYFWRVLMEIEFNHYWLATYFVDLIRKYKVIDLTRPTDVYSICYSSDGPRDNFQVILPGWMPGKYSYQYKPYWYHDPLVNPDCPKHKKLEYDTTVPFVSYDNKNVFASHHCNWSGYNVNLEILRDRQKIYKEALEDLDFVTCISNKKKEERKVFYKEALEVIDKQIDNIQKGNEDSKEEETMLYGEMQMDKEEDTSPLNDFDFAPLVENMVENVKEDPVLSTVSSVFGAPRRLYESAKEKIGKINKTADKIDEATNNFNKLVEDGKEKLNEAYKKFDSTIDSIKMQFTDFIENLKSYIPNVGTIGSVSSLLIVVIELLEFARKPSMKTISIIGLALTSYSSHVRQKIEEHKKFATAGAQAGDNNVLFSVLKTIFEVIINFFTGVKDVLSFKNFLETMKVTSTIGRGLHGITQILSFVHSAFNYVRDLIVEYATGYPSILTIRKNFGAEFDAWLETCATLFAIGGDDMKEPKFIVAVHNAITQGENFLCRACSSRGALVQYRSSIESILRVLRNKNTVDFNPDQRQFKPPPFVFCLYGKSGYGKTSTCHKFIEEVSRDIFHKKAGYASVYPRTNDEFWEGYCGQPITYYDDWMQAKDTTQNPNQNAIDLIRMANPAPFKLNMAALEHKADTFFSSSLVVMNTNVEMKNLGGHINSLVSVDAVKNRIHFEVEMTNPARDPAVRNKYTVTNIRVPGVQFKSPFTVDEEQLFQLAVAVWMHYYKHNVKILSAAQSSTHIKSLFSVNTKEDFKDYCARNDHISQYYSNTEMEKFDLDAFFKTNLVCNMHTDFNECVIQNKKMDYANISPCHLPIIRPEYTENKPFMSYLYSFPAGNSPRWLDEDIVLEMTRWIALFPEKWHKKIEHQPGFDWTTNYEHNLVMYHLVVDFKITKPTLTDVQEKIDYGCVCELVDKKKEDEKPSETPTTHADIEMLRNRPNKRYMICSIIVAGVAALSCFLYYAIDNFYLQPIKRKKEKKAAMQAYNTQNMINQIRGRMNSDVVEKPFADKNALDQIIKVIRNIVYLHYLHEDGSWRFVLSGLSLDESHILLPKHWRLLIPDNGYIKILSPQGKDGEGWSYVNKVCDVESQNVDELDAMIIKKQPTNGIRSVIKLFVDEKDVKKGCNKIGFLVGGSKNEVLRRSPLVRVVSQVEYSAVPIEYSDGNTSLITKNHYTYEIPTDVGDCGSVLIAHNPSLGSKILGHHLLNIRESIEGASCVLTRQVIERTLAKFKTPTIKIADMQANIKEICPSYTAISPTGEIETYEAPYEFSGVQYIGKIHPWSALPSNDVIPSQLFNWLPDLEKKTAPALVTPECRTLALKKVGQPDVYVSKTILDMAAKNYLNKLMSSKVRRDNNVVSLEEAVFGVPEDKFFPSINVSSSPGYEWKKLGDHNSGKSKWINLNNRFIHPDIIEAVHMRIEAAKENVAIPVIWEDVCKIERRPLEKIAQKKTRVFSAGPIDFTIAFRMYFGSFISFMMHNRIRNESAVGINPQGVEWTVLAEHLKSASTNNMIAGDFSNYDGTQNITMLWKILDIVNAWYDDEKENEIRRVLWHGIMSSVHVAGNICYAWHHSNPSGNPMTTLINTMYNCLVFRYVWYLNFPSLNFSMYVKMIAYGDDNILSISDQVADHFTPELISKGISRLGMTYTNTSKTGDVRFLKMEEVTFLKRAFIEQDGLYMAPLDLDTLLEIPCWTKRGLPTDIFAQSLCNVNDELALHGKEIYEKYSARLRKACYTAKLSISHWISYYEVLYRMFEK